jgi:hypothetical protein
MDRRRLAGRRYVLKAMAHAGETPAVHSGLFLA